MAAQELDLESENSTAEDEGQDLGRRNSSDLETQDASLSLLQILQFKEDTGTLRSHITPVFFFLTFRT